MSEKLPSLLNTTQFLVESKHHNPHINKRTSAPCVYIPPRLCLVIIREII